jgi:putative transposase
VAVLKQAELGMAVAEPTHQVGISEQTFDRWKKQYAGLHSDQARELKQQQDKNSPLKKLLAERSFDKTIPQDLNSRKLPGVR